jgi:hypothetical protein
MRKMLLALAAGFALFGGTSAWADMLDFTIPPINPGAVIAFAGDANPLVGMNISITAVTDTETAVSLPITGGILNFQTGPKDGNLGSILVFNPGGFLVITGGIPLLGIPNGTVLKSGTNVGAQVAPGVTGINVAIGTPPFADAINPALAAFFGFPATGWTGSFNISFATSAADLNAGFTSSSVLSGNVVETLAVPETSSFVVAVLSSLGLIGYGLRRRRKGE